MPLHIWSLTIDFRGERREIEYEYEDQCVTWWFQDMSEADFDALKVTDEEDDAIVQSVHRAEAETAHFHD